MAVTPAIKCEVDSENESMEEPSGQSSFDLASNNPDVRRKKYTLYYACSKVYSNLSIKNKFRFIADFKSCIRQERCIIECSWYN